MGGGAPFFEGVGLGALPFVPFGIIGSVALFMPYDSAERGGFAGGCSSEAFLACPTCSGRIGFLGGRDGVSGGGRISNVATCDDDFVAISGDLFFSTSLYPGKALAFSISLYLFSMSSFVLLGGSGGKDVGSNTGAFILPESIDGVLWPGVLPTPFDKVEMVEIVEDIDSLETFLLSCCSEGLRGGRAGEGCMDCFLVGNLGGGAGLAFGDGSSF